MDGLGCGVSLQLPSEVIVMFVFFFIRSMRSGGKMSGNCYFMRYNLSLLPSLPPSPPPSLPLLLSCATCECMYTCKYVIVSDVA